MRFLISLTAVASVSASCARRCGTVGCGRPAARQFFGAPIYPNVGGFPPPLYAPLTPQGGLPPFPSMYPPFAPQYPIRPTGGSPYPTYQGTCPDYDPSHCSCDTACIANDDCCNDYATFCSAGGTLAPTSIGAPTPEPTGCATLTDCSSCTSVYECYWSGTVCQRSSVPLPPPWAGIPSQCPIDSSACTGYTDCRTCANAAGCVWTATACTFSQFPVNGPGYANYPNQCPFEAPAPSNCTALDCTSCTAIAGCSYDRGTCVRTNFPVPVGFGIDSANVPAECTPTNTCGTSTSCSTCVSTVGCHWIPQESRCAFSFQPVGPPIISFVNQCPPPPPNCTTGTTCLTCAAIYGCGYNLIDNTCAQSYLNRPYPFADVPQACPIGR